MSVAALSTKGGTAELVVIGLPHYLSAVVFQRAARTTTATDLQPTTMVLRLSKVLCCRQLDDSRTTEEESLHVEGISWHDSMQTLGGADDDCRETREMRGAEAEVDAWFGGTQILQTPILGKEILRVPVFPSARVEPPGGAGRCDKRRIGEAKCCKDVIIDENTAPAVNHVIKTSSMRAQDRADRATATGGQQTTKQYRHQASRPVDMKAEEVVESVPAPSPDMNQKIPSSIEVPMSRLAGLHLQNRTPTPCSSPLVGGRSSSMSPGAPDPSPCMMPCANKTRSGERDM